MQLVNRKSTTMLKAILLLLFFIEIQSCWSLCKVWDQAANSQSQIQRCAKIKASLEAALLSSDVNIYTLKEVFASSNTPTLLDINYIVRLSNSNSYIDYHHHVTWTQSPVLAKIDPKLLMALQPGMTTALYPLQNMVPHHNITLILKIEALELPPRLPRRGDEIQEVLESITLQLKKYIADKNSSSEGFIAVWSMDNHSKHTVVVTILIAAILLAVFSLIITAVLSHTCFKHRQPHSTDIGVKLHMSLVKVAKIINLSECIFTAISLSKELSSSNIYCLIKGSILVVVLVIILPLLLSVLAGYCQYQHHYSRSALLCKMMYWYGVCNLYVFAFLMGLYLVPTAVLTNIHSIFMTNIIFISAAAFCLTIVLTLPSPCIWRHKSSWQKVEKKSSNVLVYLLPSTVIAMVIFLPLSFTTNEILGTNNQLMHCTLLLLPSAMLIITGMIACKRIKRNSRLKMKETEQSGQEPVRSLLLKSTLEGELSDTQSGEDDYV